MQEVKTTSQNGNVTTEIVLASMQPELTRLKVETILQEGENLLISKDNLPASYEKIKELKNASAIMNESRMKAQAPHDEKVKIIRNAYNSVIKKLDDLVERKLAEAAKIKKQIDADNARIVADNNRKIALKVEMDGFINDCIKKIAVAETSNDIGNIQKSIGSQKSRKDHWAELYTEFVTACDNLEPLINERKEIIRKKAILEKEREDALAKDDVLKLTDLMEQEELLQHEDSENRDRLQQQAFTEISSVEIATEVINEDSIKGRSYWRWEVTDLKLLAKKMPHLVEVIPNKEAINSLLSTKRNDGSLKGKKEELYFGIKFFINEIL